MTTTLQSKIESLLFVVGEEGLSLDELSFFTEEKTSVLYETLQRMAKKYSEDQECGLYIMEVGSQFVMTTKKELSSTLKKYAQSPMSHHLSQAALETLAIVAYKQPITRVEIDEIRGVQTSGSIQKLLGRNLIEERGRLDGPGRPILYGTSKYFMNYFGLESLEELPSITAIEAEFSEELSNDLFFERFKEELDEQERTNSVKLEKFVDETQTKSQEELF